MDYKEGVTTLLLFKQVNRCMRSHILIKKIHMHICSYNDSICKGFSTGPNDPELGFVNCIKAFPQPSHTVYFLGH